MADFETGTKWKSRLTDNKEAECRNRGRCNTMATGSKNRHTNIIKPKHILTFNAPGRKTLIIKSTDINSVEM